MASSSASGAAPTRGEVEVEQDVMRACTECCGAVAVTNGRVACGFITPMDCVLLDLLRVVREEIARTRGESPTAARYTSGWIMDHQRCKGPLAPASVSDSDLSSRGG